MRDFWAHDEQTKEAREEDESASASINKLEAYGLR